MDREEYLSRATEFVRRGSELPQAKLTEEMVRDIRSAHRQRQNLMKHIKGNLSNKALAEKCGLHLRTIEKVVTRNHWCHAP